MNCKPPFYSAEDLAQIVGTPLKDGTKPMPTDEQKKIIESPVDEPAVVVAGAGSGKTAVIAQRVLWLVANRYVAKDRILALTFTRKAVGELAKRINGFISAFEAYEAAKGRPCERGEDSERDPLDALFGPTVQTYNSYASALVSEYGLSIGIEDGTTILDDAEAIQEFGLLVDQAADADIPAGKSRATVIKDTLHLASQIDEHLKTSDEVVEYLDASLADAVSSDNLTEHAKAVRRKRIPKEEKEALAARLETLAAEAAGMRTLSPEFVDSAVAAVQEAGTSELIESLLRKKQYAVLAGRWKDHKGETGRMQFSDQVASAYKIMTADEQARREERGRWDIILLDEYQDTSDSQFKLLQTLFAGKAVTAVGDYRQSIYGWRGASAGSLRDFPEKFRFNGQPAQEYSLSISFRNAQLILDAANAVSAKLTAISATSAKQLEHKSRAAQGTQAVPEPDEASSGTVTICTTSGSTDIQYGLDQYRDLALWMKERTGTRAVLVRARKSIGPIADALRAADVPYAIVGSRGSLDNPYTADAVAALASAVDITASTEVMRLLSGPQAALGAKDIRGLNRFCRLRSEGLEEDAVPTLIECIDEFADDATSGDLAEQAGLSAVAISRLQSLARRLRAVRRSASSPVDALRAAIRVFNLDLDIEALPNSEPHRRAIDSLKAMAQNYGAQHPSATAADFLAWLTVAEESEALEAAAEEADPDSVQIMTIHASKGLEFSAVAIPDNTVGDLPTLPRSTKAWLAGAELPYPLRGDRQHLVDLDTTRQNLSTAKDMKKLFAGSLGEQIKADHEAEERRLAYVAVTRAETHLWLGASAMTSRTKPNTLSPFLEEIAEALGREVALPEAADPSARPTTSVVWPPVVAEQTCRQRVELIAEYRSASGTELRDLESMPDIGGLARSAQAFLEPEPHSAPAELSRLSTTALVDFVGDREEFDRQRSRPMPQEPSSAAALGTEFHAWVENRFGQSSLLELADYTPRRLGDRDKARLEQLKKRFEASEFAERTPAAVELPFELKVGPKVISGKIDAVFDTGTVLEVVDWKTGSAPYSEREMADRAIQLSMYAHAVARMPQFAGREVSAAFYFLGSDTVVRFAAAGADSSERTLLSWEQLEAAVSG